MGNSESSLAKPFVIMMDNQYLKTVKYLITAKDLVTLK
jgi:hypothetical protein